MSRRDIIIVAVLINVGLLVVLFVSALKTERRADAESIGGLAKQEVIVKSLPHTSLEKGEGGDQIDRVLSQYSAEKSLRREEKEEPFSLSTLAPAQERREEEKSPHTSTDESSTHVVKVQKGDVLERLALSYGVRVDEIIRLNHLSDSQLQVGQQLKIPKKMGDAKWQQGHGENSQVTDGDEEKYYVVKEGDNPWKIAQKCHMRVEELLRMNNMDHAKAKRLRPGDRLKVK